MASNISRTIFCLCVLVVILEITAGILAVESKKPQHKCTKSINRAFKLGFAAATLLLVAHFIVTVLVCYLFFSSLQFTPLVWVSAFFLGLAWMAMVTGVTFLVFWFIENKWSKESCPFSNHGYPLKVGFTCFVHATFCVACYLTSPLKASGRGTASA